MYSIDKIKNDLPPVIFNFWTELINHYPMELVLERMELAKKQLKKEIDNEIFGLPKYYVAELKLLEHLTKKC